MQCSSIGVTASVVCFNVCASPERIQDCIKMSDIVLFLNESIMDLNGMQGKNNGMVMQNNNPLQLSHVVLRIIFTVLAIGTTP